MKIALLCSTPWVTAEVRARLASAGMDVHAFKTVSGLLSDTRVAGFDCAVLECGEQDLPVWMSALRMKGPALMPVVVIGFRESAALAEALVLGADDYVLLRDDGRELVMRVTAHAEKRQAIGRTWRTVAGFAIDPSRFTVSCDSCEVSLTAKEFRIASHLLESEGRVVSTEALLVVAWGPASSVGKRALEQHIHKLRRKFAAAFGEALCIRSVHGLGYRLDALTQVV